MLFNEIVFYELAQNVAPLSQPIDIHDTRYTHEELAKQLRSSRGFYPLLPSFTVNDDDATKR